MFNLESSISAWRSQMLAAGIPSPVPLKELENHLREDVERQMRAGLSAEQAFAAAVQRIGRPTELKMEFKKITPPLATRLVKMAGIACLLVALFTPLCLFLNILFGRDLRLLTKMIGLAAVAAANAIAILGWNCNHRFLPAIRRQSARRAIGFVCFAGGVVWIRLFLVYFPDAMPRSLLLLAFIWASGWTVMALLGAVGHGLEKAAGRQCATTTS